MDKWVILELEGDFNLTGFRATLEIRAENDFPALKVKGFLPPSPAIAAQLSHHWHGVYRPLGVPLRIKGQKIIHKGSISQRLADCQRSAQALRDRFRAWLNAESFQPIDRRLREELSRHEVIRFLIRTQDFNLQKLPWHEWDFFERYPYAEVALSTPEYESVQPKMQPGSPHPVRILAILGHSHGINVAADRQVLAQLPQAQVSFLVEPDLPQLNDQLWETPWDILFFAGHSETHRSQGRIFINETDSLSLSELRFGLRRAIDQGLQLAIFNSCDGLGLAPALEHLGIPQMIVMREPVADQVAEAFLKYFLEVFATGEALYLCVRQARERLQGLEHQFPCASWLPVIYQNPLVAPPNWQTLQGQPAQAPQPAPQPTPQSRPQLRGAKPIAPATPARASSTSPFPGFRRLWISIIVTGVIVALRLLGILQPVELAAYDYLMRSRPAETVDSRILIVEVTQTDLDALGGYPLADAVLAETVEVLQALRPTAIALDMHRHRPRGAGRQPLLNHFQQHSNLFTVCAFDQIAQDYDPPVEFSDNQRIEQVGFSNVILDKPTQMLGQHRNVTTVVPQQAAQPGGVVRRHLLSYNPDLASTQSRCSTPYSLSLQLVYRYLHQAEIEPLTVTENDQWQFGSVVFQPLTRRFGGYQTLNGLSTQLMLNYRAAQPGQQVSLQEVLAGQISADRVQDRLVLVGYTAPVARDTLDTPYGKMAGVWLHAHMVSQLLSAVLDQRPLIKVLPQWRSFQWGDAGWILGGSLLSGGVSHWVHTRRLRSRRLGLRLGWRLGAILTLVAMTWGLSYLCLVALSQGLWLPLIPTGLSVLLTGGFVVLRRSSKHRL
ncbi:MAG: CHASE2 domain-containing protein [Leptolyngbya sp. SIO1E4]|nr:CHASE2 domain-containing protein [Leptolyngbya sp. SIO1E4]